jgi:PKD repeat protein
MKLKHLLFGLFMLFAFGMHAQTLVSTEPQLKNAVLEEYTGIHCGYCPDGHAIAADLLANNPGRVVVLAIHQGSFANPSPGEPDYMTPWGDALASQAGISSYPSGTVNRHLFDGQSNTGMSRGDWTPSANIIMQETSPVNVGIQTSYEEATRELTVNVELYYTADAAEASNFINVALIQSHIFGPQSGGNAGDNYEHMHMLRDLITGQWGEEIFETSAGSFIEKTYTYTVPEDFNDVECVVEDCEIAVFVCETHQEILTGDVVHAINGTNQFIGNVAVADEYDIQAGTPSNPTTFNVEMSSNLADGEEFELTLEGTDVPADWNAEFVVDGSTYTNTAIIEMNNAETKNIEVIITPGASAAIAEYILTMSSVGVPEAPAKQAKMYLISGVSDMIVNGTGGPESVEHQDVYISGLEAVTSAFAVTNASIMEKAMAAGAMENVNNVYMNIAWTFPALTIPQIEATKSFMNGGGNLLIAGQDIGWDMMSGADGSHPSDEATDFYENYLHSNYIDDGSTSNSQYIADENDDIYGSIAQSSVVDMFGGNMYPEQLEARDGAFEPFFYDAAMSKCGAVRAETGDYKVVYFGIGLEMLGNEAVKDEILAVTKAWFDGGAIAPSAEFSASETGITIHESIVFTDLSSNSPTEWDWTFEGGTPASSDEQNPEVTYHEVGVFSVTLTAQNSGGSNSITKEEYITVEYGIGIEKLEDQHVAIYPNPISEQVLNIQSIITIDELVIYDNLGREVLRKDVNAKMATVKTEPLKRGIYFAKLNSSKGNIIKKVVIK